MYLEFLLLFLFTKLLPSTNRAALVILHSQYLISIFNLDVLFIFQGHQNLLLAPCMIEACTGTHLVMLLDSLQDLVMQIVVHALAQANDVLVCPSTNGVQKIAVTIVLESVISQAVDYIPCNLQEVDYLGRAMSSDHTACKRECRVFVLTSSVEAPSNGSSTSWACDGASPEPLTGIVPFVDCCLRGQLAHDTEG